MLFGSALAAESNANPCAQDVEKFCSSTPVGGGQRLACLQQHASELSAECQAHMNKRELRRGRQRGDNPNRAWISACAQDVKKLCSGIVAGRGVIARCLDQHESSLSESCKIARAGRKQS